MKKFYEAPTMELEEIEVSNVALTGSIDLPTDDFADGANAETSAPEV